MFETTTMPITTTTPVDTEIGKILAQHFPSVNFGNEDAEAEVDIIAIKNAIAQAFAAGRDFEAEKIATKKAKAKLSDEERAARLQALGVQPAAFWCYTDADIVRAERKAGAR